MAMIPPKVERLSAHTAQILFDKMSGYDKMIDAQILRVKGMTAAIADAYATANAAWQDRQELARELNRLAPDDFTPNTGQSTDGCAPASDDEFDYL